MSTQTAKPIRLAGVLYAVDTPERNALLGFAETLKNRGWHVAGLTQELAYDEKGEKIGLDAIDIRTGEHFPLARPSKEDRESGTCGFDVGLLCESSSVLRRAIEEKADLLVIEKFGEREQTGDGLAQEIITAAMAGIPTLVAVPATALETWNEFTGRLGTLVPHDSETLWQWWPKWNIYKELAHSISNLPATHIEVGKNAILVQSEHGCGVTANPTGKTDIEIPTNLSLKAMAGRAQNLHNPIEHALGIAAILAHHNRFDMEGSDHSGLTHFQGRDDQVLVVGNFPPNKDYANDFTLMNTDKAIPHLIGHSYDGVILPSHTFGDGLLPTLLETKGRAETVLVGPETPLCEKLFDYGIDVLSGRIIVDSTKAIEIVKSGGSPKDLKPACRYITLEK
ncbi:conserved hypothetical protein [Candidatus Terasakiella magnetica]|uniref:Putative heavy-metal chelation domain-containing protein n=1 Tax=Candidatus Terasakiella magnetica TaxID=1867952 RepID=A0A1C3RKG5_9PROT|nr:DUF2478 domain-containing protein [Candidatus Terasakiella magnetica]SCA57812.1 conserved hypothetical protein [Candidatus Terasakiella magnetica]